MLCKPSYNRELLILYFLSVGVLGCGIHMACCHTDVCDIRVTETNNNLYTTLDNKAKGVVHFKGKYEAVLTVV